MTDTARRAPSFDVVAAGLGLYDVYTMFDQDAACARGWCLNEYGDGMIGIVRDDDSNAFEDAAHAHEHVTVSSVMSPDQAYRDLCAQALAIEAASIAIRDATAEDED